MPSPARILDLCDGVVGLISATPGLSTTDGSKVQRSYAPTISTSVDDPPTLIQGRQVNVLPIKWDEPEWVDRETLLHGYSLAILTAELWRVNGTVGQGDVPVEWVDERVNFVEAFMDVLKSRVGGDSPGDFVTGAFTHCYRLPGMAASVDVVCLDTFLRERKLFWSVCSIDFVEQVTIGGQ